MSKTNTNNLQNKSMQFAIRIVQMRKYLVENLKEYELNKQLSPS